MNAGERNFPRAEKLQRISTVERCLALVLIAGLGYATLSVIRDTLASLYAVPALQLMQEWDLANVVQPQAGDIAPPGASAGGPGGDAPIASFSPDEAEWQLAYAALQRAINLAPGNPELYANLGRLYQFKFEDNSLPLEDIDASAHEASTAFNMAARLRPTWPYHWWDIARTEYVLQRSHLADFRRALDNGVRFGPWLRDVQLFSADLALEHWDTLGTESRQLALANFDRALVRSPEFVPDIIAAYDAWDMLCQQAEGLAPQLPTLPVYCADPDLRTSPSPLSLDP
ncbi:hypothetical protein [Haliea sp. E17]|uniref:hypothetical protein n=1 Tax=Haliea sp. E17 TaxID=3401576 RepID=UPI003AAD974C